MNCSLFIENDFRHLKTGLFNQIKHRNEYQKTKNSSRIVSTYSVEAKKKPVWAKNQNSFIQPDKE